MLCLLWGKTMPAAVACQGLAGFFYSTSNTEISIIYNHNRNKLFKILAKNIGLSFAASCTTSSAIKLNRNERRLARSVPGSDPFPTPEFRARSGQDIASGCLKTERATQFWTATAQSAPPCIGD
jgi:hypothetical protein